MTLEERLDALEGALRGLKVEWLDTYDKLYRLAGRLDASRRWGEKTPSPSTTEAPNAAQGEAAGLLAEPGEPEPKNGGTPRTRRELLAAMTRI